MNQHRQIEQILRSKRRLVEELQVSRILPKSEEEGGCGVVGFCCSEPVPGKHIHEPSKQMHNRGNGKGGGIAAVGFMPEQLGVSREVLDHYYMLHIALLDSSVREEMEKRFIAPHFEVATASRLDTCADWRAMPGLAVKPPDVWRYFVKVKPKVLESFRKQNKLDSVVAEKIEDEFVNQNSFKLNQAYYASLGEQKAFVLSHGKNIMILKVVGYAEAITQYYQIEDLCAYVWIAHQRYPTKGRVWHPGGAHPFAGINMALVHNGDFANYHSVGEYLQQRHIYPQFLTDTEVSALMFDLLNRTYEYPLEYIIEALAPTTELDFDKLPEARRKIYRAIQATHIHGSPDGPWFFIIARNLPGQNQHQLLGITDTAMLRPQVFAFSDGEIQVGLICSEKQAIDATLRSLSEADKRICPVADRYWNARGGSYNDGGAFIFTLSPDSDGKMGMTCTDKFGEGVTLPRGDEPCDFSQGIALSLESEEEIQTILSEKFVPGNDFAIFELICELLPQWTFDEFRAACRQITYQANDAAKTASAIKVLTLLNDRKYPYGNKKFSHIIKIVREELKQIFHNLPGLGPDDRSKKALRRIDFATRPTLREPHKDETTLVIDAEKFAAEGADCDAALLVDAFMLGWRKFIVFNCRGQRYLGCGLGPETDDVTIDAYDSSGDYLGSGLDGLTLTVHGNAQDQLGQIIKRGKLVIHGDVGQTFMYGAKGGEVYVLGNAAGRPLINSVGKPKVVINGTSLDFLAESFMAGDPLNGGGFVILNGIRLNENGKIVPLPEPYPGCNLFSLASGGAIYVRDPHKLMVDQQLNGGEFVPMTSKDWQLILPYLEENERLFGIKVKELLTVEDRLREPVEVYRKVMPSKGGVPESETDDVTAEGEMIEELSIST